MQILSSQLKHKIKMIFDPEYRESYLDKENQLNLILEIDDQDIKYIIPSYLKPETQSWDWWRARVGKGKMPF